MQAKPNEDIRRQLRESGLFQYDVADEIGINEVTFIRWLRKPLEADRRVKVLNAINKLSHKEYANE